MIQSWDMINAYRVSFAIGLSMEGSFGPLYLNYVVYVKNAFFFMIASFHLWIENILTTLRGLNFDLAMNIIRRIEKYFLWHEFEVPIPILPPCILFKKYHEWVIFLPNLTVAILAIFVEIEQCNGSVY